MLVSPESYAWLLPWDVMGIPISKIVEYAEAGKFPVIEEILYPALGYAAFFGIARMILTHVAFRVSSLNIAPVPVLFMTATVFALSLLAKLVRSFYAVPFHKRYLTNLHLSLFSLHDFLFSYIYLYNMLFL